MSEAAKPMVPSPDAAALEGIPRICSKACMLWGSVEFEAFVNKLVMDSRDGSRQGLPLEIASELLWLVEINKWRRAYEATLKLHIPFDEALALVEQKSAASDAAAVWIDPNDARGNLGRRYTDKPRPVRPKRRHEENTLFGIVFGFVTNKYVLLCIIAILTLKMALPYLDHMLAQMR